MATKERQIISISFEQCKPAPICDQFCSPGPNRHYPYIGTLSVKGQTLYERMDLQRINIMISPANKIYPSPILKLLDRPRGYKFWTSVHDNSAELWSRYYWSTGRVPQLVAGDILQEKYNAKRRTNLTPIELMEINPQTNRATEIIGLHRNFLVIEDLGSGLKLMSLASIPKEPATLMKLLRQHTDPQEQKEMFQPLRI